MAELPYTALRHATLTAVREGRVSRGRRERGFEIKPPISSTYAHMERTISEALGAGLARWVDNSSSAVTLTEVGTAKWAA